MTTQTVKTLMLRHRARSFFQGQGGLSVYLSLITTTQIVISFATQLYTVTSFGAGRDTDALYTGLTLPLVLTVLLIETLTVVVIPLLTAEPEHELRSLGWQLFLGSGAFFCSVSLLLFLLAPLFVPLLVPGFSEPAQQLTISMTRIQVWSLAGTGCYAVLSSLCQVRGRFVWALLSQLIAAAVGAFILVWKLKEFGLPFAAWMQLLVAFVPVFLLLPILGRLPRLTWRLDFFTTIWRNMRPMLMGKAYFLLNAPVDRVLASHLAPGTIVIFELVGRFYSAIVRILNKGIVMPTLPTFSRLAQEGKWERFLAIYRRKSWQMGVVSFLIIVSILICVTAGRVFASELHLAAGVAGKLNPESLRALWLITILMAAVLPATCIGNVQGNVFFAQNDTRTPTRIGVVFCTLGFGTKIAGFFIAGLEGVIIGGTLGAVGQAIVTEIVLKKRLAIKIRHGRHEFLPVSSSPRNPVIPEPIGAIERS